MQVLNNVPFHTYTSVPGTFPTLFTREGNMGSKRVSIGADADSFYEYLIKLYYLTGESEEFLRVMYNRARF